VAITTTDKRTEIKAINLTNTVEARGQITSVSTVDGSVAVSAVSSITSVQPVVQDIQVVTAGIQGPAGVGGTGTGGAAYAYRVYDAISEPATYYKGWSNNSDTAQATWKILKGVESPPGTFTETLADGNDNPDNIWDNRLSLVYL